MGNSFGTLFTLTSWGESHGKYMGVVVDGCPPSLPLNEADIQRELDRRRPGQSAITTPRQEEDRARIISGTSGGYTLGTPIAILIPNKDARPSAYDAMKDTFRPSHADYTYQSKYGIRNHEGGGRASARETIARVAAGAIAKKILKTAAAVEILAYTERIHDIQMPPLTTAPTLESIEENPVRCPHGETAGKMIERIEQMRDSGDSIGGVIHCCVQNLPVGLGAPVFDRLEADLAKAMLSLPATKGFEIGSGFTGTLKTGSTHNDLFENQEGRIRTVTNYSGGVQGGISNGECLYFRVAFKATSTIRQPQQTVDKDGNPTELVGRGRHDPCVVPRAVPIVEAMTALVLVDHWMRHAAQCRTFSF